jgi:hypothetical protein
MDGRRAADKSPPIERVGAGGKVGEGRQGRPLQKPQEDGDRERVGAGGPVGKPPDDAEKQYGDATRAVVEQEFEQGDASKAAEPDQKDELDDQHG